MIPMSSSVRSSPEYSPLTVKVGLGPYCRSNGSLASMHEELSRVACVHTLLYISVIFPTPGYSIHEKKGLLNCFCYQYILSASDKTYVKVIVDISK